jgi:hypothetical protein
MREPCRPSQHVGDRIGHSPNLACQEVRDRVVWLEYLKTVVKDRDGWKDIYRACMDVM